MIGELVKSAQSGDRDALEALVSRYEVRIRLYAAGLVPGHAMAEDIAQEAFLIAFSNIQKFDVSKDFGLWVRGIVRNLARREWQRMSRNKAKVEDLTHHVEMLAEESSQASDMDEHVSALRRCIEKLPAKSTQLLQMVYELNFTLAEIAERIRSSLSAVKKAISRVRFKLKECVEEELAATGV